MATLDVKGNEGRVLIHAEGDALPDLHFHFHESSAELSAKLDALQDSVDQLNRGVTDMASGIDLAMGRLNDKVTKIESVGDSMKTTMQGIADQLRANAGNADAINAIADSLDSKADDWAAAVTANTPASDSTGDTTGTTTSTTSSGTPPGGAAGAGTLGGTTTPGSGVGGTTDTGDATTGSTSTFPGAGTPTP